MTNRMNNQENSDTAKSCILMAVVVLL